MSDDRLFVDPPVPTGEDVLWETFHENSKTSRYDLPPSDHEVLARMAMLAESLTYHGYPAWQLPEARPLTMSLGEAIRSRFTSRTLIPADVDLPTAATLLRSGYGVTHDQRSVGYPRAFRATPSAGALYPLELYFYSAFAVGFPSGLYHYSPAEDNVRLLRSGDLSHRLGPALVSPALATEASLLVFVTAVFGRTVFKYGDRGYRFILLEAGHVAQNLNLAAAGLGLSCINLGGFFDRQVDDLLDLDGLTHSTVYMVAIGIDRDGSGTHPR
jgi:SagB-type dehydrogenase family enzyme